MGGIIPGGLLRSCLCLGQTIDLVRSFSLSSRAVAWGNAGLDGKWARTGLQAACGRLQGLFPFHQEIRDGANFVK